MKKKRKNLSLWLFIIGAFIIMIPQIRILYNEIIREYDLYQYQNQIDQVTIEEREILLEEMREQRHTVEQVASNNQQVSNLEMNYIDPFSVIEDEEGKSFSSSKFPNNMLGYIVIPKIGERLPIYIGATDYHLSLGTATVEGASFPGGGPGTHSVISGHRGYAGANYFRHIDLLKEGDLIELHILNEILLYAVTGNAIISPYDSSSLKIVEGEDLLTLLSCHPYRVNNQRILIYAKRVPSKETQSSLLSNYQNLVASTSNISSYELYEKKEGTDFTGKNILDIIVKFLDPSLERAVRKELLFNRLIIVLCLFAILGAFSMIYKNNHIKNKK